MTDYRKRLNELRAEARGILRGAGTPGPKELLDLAKGLKKLNEFAYARKLLGRAREMRITDRSLRIQVGQQHALCTYKDPDLPLYTRLDQASQILTEVVALQDRYEDLKRMVDQAPAAGLTALERKKISQCQETLGLTGSIYKQRWQVDARKRWLELSYLNYNRGYELGPEGDFGYTGINAAFVLDQLCWLEEQEAQQIGAGQESQSRVRERHERAEEIREKIRSMLPGLADGIKRESGRDLWKEWWFVATGAEACFGLGLFEEAWETWLQPAKELQEGGQVDPWEFEGCATQLASLARIRWERVEGRSANRMPLARQGETEGEGSAVDSMEESLAWEVLEKFLDHQAEAVRTVFAGKLGLALSGGGFRASFYHIGVLARLAELDLLRHVHVLSCVSGGSIVGAHYYLELRQLLGEKPDSAARGLPESGAVNREDYIEIVERIAAAFLKGVEKNIRTRVVGNLFKNLRMVFSAQYSRTVRAGELYEEMLYRRVKDEDGRSQAEGSKRRHMGDLYVFPKGAEPDFNPKYYNWRRRNKVPMLVLNATTLNTGHNWQFTASWMGESPYAVNTEFDGNWRYRRMYYSQAPEKYRNLYLGTAVGASACVPGLFEPVTFTGLYPKRDSEFPDMTVRLVDGGVHDNQGVASLLEQDCSVIFVSDASGQMTSAADPGGGVLGPLLRTNGVLMERVRLAQFTDLEARRRASLLKGLAVVHMKKGLTVDPVSWQRCKEPPEVPLSRHEDMLEYGVLRRVQESLADIRTDLDSFSEVEAHSLMASGYLMADCYSGEIHRLLSPHEKGEKHNWEFLKMVPALRGEAPSEKQQDEFEKLLEVGSKKAFKIWQISPVLRALSVVLAIAAGVGFLWIWLRNPDLKLVELSVHQLGTWLLWSAIGLVATGAVAGAVLKVVRYEQTLRDLIKDTIKGVVLSVIFFVVAWIHLAIFDPWFLHRGRAARIIGEPDA